MREWFVLIVGMLGIVLIGTAQVASIGYALYLWAHEASVGVALWLAFLLWLKLLVAGLVLFILAKVVQE